MGLPCTLRYKAFCICKLRGLLENPPVVYSIFQTQSYSVQLYLSFFLTCSVTALANTKIRVPARIGVWPQGCHHFSFRQKLYPPNPPQVGGGRGKNIRTKFSLFCLSLGVFNKQHMKCIHRIIISYVYYTVIQRILHTHQLAKLFS